MHPNNKASLPAPVAMLVIYDTGFKFKYKKYYLREGLNLVGSHPSCQVLIAEKDVPEKAAVIEITSELATLQPCKQRCVYVPANMKKKSKILVEIDSWTKYVIEMERDFSLCGRKTMMQMSTLEQLLQVKGVANAEQFDLSNKVERSPSNNGNQLAQQRVPMNSYDSTLPVEYSAFQPTIQLANTYQLYEPTQVIPDENAQFDPTLPIDDDIIPQSYHRDSAPNPTKESVPAQGKSPSVQVHGSIKNNSSQKDSKQKPAQPQVRALSEAEVSMPSTIRQDDEMPDTLKQDQAIPDSSGGQANAGTFPPTLQQQTENQKLAQIKKKSDNLTKSQPVYRQIKDEKSSRLGMNFSMKQKKQEPIDSFEDLFGGIDNIQNSNKTVSLKSQNSKGLENRPLIRQTNSENQSQKTEKLEDEQIQNLFVSPLSGRGRTSKIEKIPEVAQQSQSLSSQGKLCLVFGKLPRNDQDRLISKGYRTIEDSQVTDLARVQLIVVQGEWKLSKNLLLGLIQGKDIKPSGWIRNQNSKALGKLEGFLVEHVLKRKGKGKNIFDRDKNFFLQEELREQFEEVMVAAGASMVNQLDKRKAKMSIHIVVDQKTPDAKDLYSLYKNYKNWGFYNKRAVIESTLMGEEILDKYKLDAYSF